MAITYWTKDGIGIVLPQSTQHRVLLAQYLGVGENWQAVNIKGKLFAINISS